MSAGRDWAGIWKLAAKTNRDKAAFWLEACDDLMDKVDALRDAVHVEHARDAMHIGLTPRTRETCNQCAALAALETGR